jgi:hypothetical protein
MGGSKILAALEEFKAKYAWDKSLIIPSNVSTSCVAGAGASRGHEEFSNTSIEDFLRAARS